MEAPSPGGPPDKNYYLIIMYHSCYYLVSLTCYDVIDRHAHMYVDTGKESIIIHRVGILHQEAL